MCKKFFVYTFRHTFSYIYIDKCLSLRLIGWWWLQISCPKVWRKTTKASHKNIWVQELHMCTIAADKRRVFGNCRLILFGRFQTGKEKHRCFWIMEEIGRNPTPSWTSISLGISSASHHFNEFSKSGRNSWESCMPPPLQWRFLTFIWNLYFWWGLIGVGFSS